MYEQLLFFLFAIFILDDFLFPRLGTMQKKMIQIKITEKTSLRRNYYSG